MLKAEESNQAKRAQIKSRRVDINCELRDWVAHVINDAERNGDTRKKNRFLALQAELQT